MNKLLAADKLLRNVHLTIQELCVSIDSGKGQHDVLGIGFATTDEVLDIGAFLLFEGDLPVDAEVFQRLCPVGWQRSEEDAFNDLNHFLSSHKAEGEEPDSDYGKRIRTIVDALILVLNQVDLRRKNGGSLYLHFGGVDPNPILFKQEKRFVEAMNTRAVYEQWCVELG